MLKSITKTKNTNTTILIRAMVGLVFLSEGIQKIIYPSIRGAGRLAKLNFPAADFLGTFVASFEIVCGVCILAGFLTRLASIPLITIMIVAFATTKAEIYNNSGFWEVMHASRTDWAMLLGSLFLFINGSGRWSIDRRIS